MATGRVPTTANSPLTAKGDLFGYSTTQARVAVGNDGETLVADSSTSTGLRYTGNFAAGKNIILNGDFSINQRNFTSTTSNGYGFDRWTYLFNDGTCTYSTQTFTLGTAPVAGYEGKTFARLATVSQTAAGAYSLLDQRVESVRTDAGQTVTISFWAKADSGTPKVAVEFIQAFGTGGSPSADVNTYAGQVTISTSWARYSLTVAIPSISGKTIGTGNNDNLTVRLFTSAGSNFNSRTGSLGIQNNTIDFWGVQLEAGSVATAFQTATGTIQGELAACQRYYWRNTLQTSTEIANVVGRSSTVSDCIVNFPVPMRTNPSSVEYGGTPSLTDPNVAAYTVTSVTFVHATSYTGFIRPNTASGLTQGKFYTLGIPTSGYLGFSAEL